MNQDGSDNRLLALDVPLDADLSLLSRLLWQRGVAHRIFERRGRQLLVVQRPGDRQPVIDLYDDICTGRLQLQQRPRQHPVMPWRHGLRRPLQLAPVTLLLLALSLLGALAAQLDSSGRLLAQLSFTAPQWRAGGLVFVSLGETLAAGEVWRLITPVFLHFGALHLVFNMLWLWEFGRRIELRHGAGRLLLLLLLCGIGGNLGQYLSHPGVLFGGMSGVIYGLLAYCWLWSRLRPQDDFQLPGGIMVVMVAWLLLCASGLVEAAGLGAIANAAHLSGLVLGLLAAAVFSAGGSRRDQGWPR